MPKLRSLLLVFATVLFAVAAHTQTQVQTGSGAGSGAAAGKGSDSAVSVSRTGVVAVSGTVGGFIGPGFSGTKGQPFSADVIDETDQFLADGNHIHRENHGKMFRDSEGRTRTETELSIGRTLDGEPLVHVTIMDPVQHQMISLEPRQKQAVVFTMGRLTGLGGAVAVRPGAPGSPAGQSPTPGQGTSVEPGAPVASTQRLARPSHDDLGTSTIEGFTVTGTRFSRTIPAGERGNDKPMTTTDEAWFSRELGVSLVTKSESPESGVRTHKLVNIRTGEPDPLLFQVPVDYTVREQPQR